MHENNLFPVYSVIIPLKNEVENIRPLVQELEEVMQGLYESWELICIDDGSTDGTTACLIALAEEKPYINPLFFEKNYGQSSAFDAGFRAARGQFVITLDGDGQNDPRDIPRLISLISTYDLVCGIRVQRRDTFIKRLTSKLANAVRRFVCRDGIADTGCSLKIYRKICLDRIKMYDGLHRFLPALFQIEGFRIGQIHVNHRERWRGKSHYHFLNRSYNTLLDLFAIWWMQRRHLRYRLTSPQSEG